MNVMNSPVDLRARNDHLKHLLDQRAARADLHGRFPSLSEFSDSPSVYSHPQFSPRPPDRSILNDHPHSFHFPQSPKAYNPSLAEPRSPISDRERLNIPNASSLDLEDDPRSSSELGSTHDGEDNDSPPDEEEEETRIGVYGPKMRFHSPAPWEEDEVDAKSVVEEPTKRPKKKSDSAKKGWGLSRTSGETRPSNESTRSGKGKQSFDAASNISATGALAALAQASMSSTSLAVHQSPHSLRDKLSLPRLRSRTPSNVGHSDAISPSNASPISRIATPPQTVDVYGDTHSFIGRSSSLSGSSQHEYMHPYAHPYANPDLVRAADHDLPLPSPSAMSFAANRSDSNATLTDTTSSLSHFRSTTTFGMTPGTSVTSMNPSLSESISSARFTGKGISSPMPIDKATLHPGTLSKLNGFQQSPVTPVSGISPSSRNRDTAHSNLPMGGLSTWENASGGALKLISLEEAQAQARERSRSATAHPTISSPFVGPKPLVPESEVDGPRPQGRARSSSAGGAKGRGMLESSPRYVPPVPGDSSPLGGPTRHVARKKSGFMRLFNGKERISPSSPPPPVPSFSTDAFSPVPPPQHPRPRQGSTHHRVPVPPLSPDDGNEINSSSPAESPPTSSSGSSASNSSGMREQQQLNIRRKVPELSIVTSPSLGGLAAKVPHTAPLSAGSSDMTHHHLTPTTAVSHAGGRNTTLSPSSAPPSKTDFVGLSIRPISTLFTTELKELANTDGVRLRPSLEADIGTPTTATTAISPLSPDFANAKALGYGGRSSDERSSISIAQDDRDQSNVIQALQEQILSTRRAWQRQIWELEGQVRDLKTEVEELRAAEAQGEYCVACGRGSIGPPGVEHDVGSAKAMEELKKAGVKVGGVVNRPRARTGVGSRFGARE